MAVLVANVAGLVLVAWCGWRGYRRGLLLSLLGILNILCAYLGAYLLAAPLGQWIHQTFGWMPVQSVLAAGVAVFLLILFLFAQATRSLKKSFREREKARGGTGLLGNMGRPAGALLGMTLGLLWLVLVFWLYALARGTPVGAQWPDLTGSLPVGFSSRVVEQGAYHALKGHMDPVAAQRLAAMAGRPDRAAAELAKIMEHPAMRGLLTKEFAEDVLSGNEQQVRANPQLKAVFDEPELVEAFVNLGLLPDDADPVAQHAMVCRPLALAGARLGPVIDHPDVQKDINSLAEEGLFEIQKIHRLLLDPRAMRLLDRMLTPAESEPHKNRGQTVTIHFGVA